MTNNVIYLLIDYREMFYSSTREVAGSMDVRKLKTLFEHQGYKVYVKRFSDVNFYSDEYRGAFILYQSSEDPDLRYKEYIEDVLLGLELLGAYLVPRFQLFRAHHNKVFMEILRDLSHNINVQSTRSRVYGTAEDLMLNIEYPAVIKPSAGSQSNGVQLAKTPQELISAARRIARSFSTMNARWRIASFFSGKGFKTISQHRSKFIVQDYIDGLDGDYKVLVYADRYYVLRRNNRANDFRASGSGLLSYPNETPSAVLTYAESVFRYFNTPFASFDIATKDEKLFLLEFQFLSFGQYALEHSNHYYIYRNGMWQRVDTSSDLEDTFTYAVHVYLKKQEA